MTAATTLTDQPAAGHTAQIHALRSMAEFLDQLGLPDLYLVFNNDRVTVQVPGSHGAEQVRTATVGRLAAALGTYPTHQRDLTGTQGWLAAYAALDGHQVHVYTPLDDN